MRCHQPVKNVGTTQAPCGASLWAVTSQPLTFNSKSKPPSFLYLRGWQRICQANHFLTKTERLIRTFLVKMSEIGVSSLAVQLWGLRTSSDVGSVWKWCMWLFDLPDTLLSTNMLWEKNHKIIITTAIMKFTAWFWICFFMGGRKALLWRDLQLSSILKEFLIWQ